MTTDQNSEASVEALKARIRELEKLQASLVAKPTGSDDDLVLLENVTPSPRRYLVMDPSGEGFKEVSFGPRPLPDPKNPLQQPKPLEGDLPTVVAVPRWMTTQVDTYTHVDKKTGEKRTVPHKNKDNTDRLGPVAAAIKKGILKVQASA